MSNKLRKMEKDKNKEPLVLRNPTITLNNSDVEKMKTAITRDAMEKSYALMVAFAVEILEKEFGYGDYMQKKFIDHAFDYFEEVKTDNKKMIAIINKMQEKIVRG